MFQILNQPFPAPDRLRALRMAAAMGVFVAAFLLFFQPFGLHTIPEGANKVFAILGYGLITFCCVAFLSVILPRLVPSRFNATRWTVKKEIFMTLLNFITVGYFNLLYTFLIFKIPFSFSNLFYFEAITLAVGILPVSLIVVLRHNRLLAENLKAATEMNAGIPPVESQLIPSGQTPNSASGLEATFAFTSETGTEQVSMLKGDFLFAAAADNYAELHYLEEGLYKKSLIRSSLTRVEHTVSAEPKVVRSHRGFIVNLNHVKHVSGNAQGLKLELHGTTSEVPVSRNMVFKIKALLHS